MKKTNAKTRTLLEIINEKDIQEILTVEPESTVIEALTIMAKFKIPKVEEIMTKKVLTLSAGDKCEKGLEIMTKNRIRHMPVMNGKELLGMVSQGDLVKEMMGYQKLLIKELEAFVYWLLAPKIIQHNIFGIYT